MYFYNPTAVFLPDSIGYAKIAENLYNHFAFSQSPDPSNLYPDSMRTPIYPGLLWLMYIFQITIPWLLIFQSFLGAHAVYLVYLICKQFQFTEKVSLGAAILLAINFNSIYFSSAVLTEILFQWLVLFSFYQLQRVVFYQNAVMRKRGVAHITFATSAGNRTFKYLNETDASRLYDWSLAQIEQSDLEWM